MKVGNIEVTSKGTEVVIKVTTGRNWTLSFPRNACNNYHAELEVSDIYNGLREHRRELQREIIRALRNRRLAGLTRGKLAKALSDIETVYGL